MSFLWNLGGAKKPQGSAKPSSPPHFQSMNVAFRRGVQYNMKVVIRGDVMTGKSSLFRRLQGAEFNNNYMSTPQIEVSNIQWKYKDSPDIIKVEIWDVVDRAKNATPSSEKTDIGIKLEHSASKKPVKREAAPADELSDMGLDASTVNVYRNCHAAIFMFDITKPWTFEYVVNELSAIPGNMAILVLGNFNDKGSNERKVTLDEVHSTLFEINQERIKEKEATKPNLIRYIECSMQTGNGLRYIYNYLGIPFIQLQIETMRQQLENKAIEAVDLLDELDQNEQVPEQFQRLRGQDNFSEPATARLTEQQSSMRQTWDAELDDIARDHEPSFDIPLKVPISKTPTPPMTPVQVKTKRKSIPPPTKEDVPAAIDHFSAGAIDTDFFLDEPTEASTKISQSSRPPNRRADSDDGWGGGNPVVASDEDLDEMEYYGAEGHVSTKKVASDGSDDDDESTQLPSPTPKFKSSLLHVWEDPSAVPVVTSQGIVSQHNAQYGESDSDDEDNRYGGTEFGVTGSGTATEYEEIGGADNPWTQDLGRFSASEFDNSISNTDEIQSPVTSPHSNSVWGKANDPSAPQRHTNMLDNNAQTFAVDEDSEKKTKKKKKKDRKLSQ